MKHVLSIKQFADKTLLASLFESAAKLQAMDRVDYPKTLQNKTLATIFYEPSTRTRLSFETAVQNLGGQIITTENAGEFSSAIKGESIEDTIRVINAYADGIILRHHTTAASDRAAAVSRVPIINAGDDVGEHPTQALLDAYSIVREKGKIDGLKIGLVGDLLHSRTIHSLAQLLSLYDVEIYLVSPENLRLPESYMNLARKDSLKYEEMVTWGQIIGTVDVLYINRVPKERFESTAEYEKLKDSFVLTLADVQKMKPDAIILDPLPRTNEIAAEVDADPRAKYFEQVRNGLFLRMALLDSIYSDMVH